MNGSDRRRTAGTVAGLALLVAVACEPTAPVDSDLHLTFDEVAGADGTAVWQIEDQGTGAFDIDVATDDGGRVRAAPGSGGRAADRALRFPWFDPTDPAAEAVVRVVPTGTVDALDPGTGPVAFGADFAIDAASDDQSPGSIDDGDNIVQRGRWGDPGQYKLEVNGTRPVCRFAGRSGAVEIYGSPIEPERWYRARCERAEGTATLAVTSWDADGAAATRTWNKPDPSGDLSPASAATPLSIGGKLGWGGGVATDPDQFNGRIDEVWVAVG